MSSTVIKPFNIAVCLIVFGWCLAANAADESSFDKVWNYANLYEKKDNPFIQKFALTGRIQIDSAWFDAEQGEYSDLLWRRFRFGFKSLFFQNWTLHIEGDWDLNEKLGDMYNRLTDAYIGWNPVNDTDIKVLKQSAGFTLDGATSSNKLLTLQRNNLTNNLWFTAEYFTGATIAGTFADQGDYKAGLFSSDGSDGLSHFEAAYFTLLSFGYNFANPLGLKNATVRVDYVYNDEDEESDTSDYSHVLSLVTKWEQGKWALWTDLSAGWGFTGESDMWGVVLMPSYDLSPHLQLVLRYTYLDASNDNGLVLGRYENEIVEGQGDRYNEFYGGLNVYFYGHKLKWQTGLQYSKMSDNADDDGEYEGWGLTTGLRVSW